MLDHKKLEVWPVGVNLVTKVYQITQDFPTNELSGLTSQIRRIAVSIPATIAEGAAQQTAQDFVRFLSTALTATAELETQINIARRLKYIKQADDLLINLASVKNMLQGLIRHYQPATAAHD